MYDQEPVGPVGESLDRRHQVIERSTAQSFQLGARGPTGELRNQVIERYGEEADLRIQSPEVRIGGDDLLAPGVERSDIDLGFEAQDSAFEVQAGDERLDRERAQQCDTDLRSTDPVQL